MESLQREQHKHTQQFVKPVRSSTQIRVCKPVFTQNIRRHNGDAQPEHKCFLFIIKVMKTKTRLHMQLI